MVVTNFQSYDLLFFVAINNLKYSETKWLILKMLLKILKTFT